MPDLEVNVAVRRRGLLWRVFHSLMAVALIALLALPRYVKTMDAWRQDVVRTRTFEIQFALQRYSVDDPESCFPGDIDDLMQGGYLADLPLNPFTGTRMREIQLGETPFAGEFTYVPILSGEKVTGFRLYGYGSPRHKVEGAAPGLEHVVYVMEDVPPHGKIQDDHSVAADGMPVSGGTAK